MKQTQAEKQKYYSQYRKTRLDAGWTGFYRIIPQDLAVELSRVIAKHKDEHFDIWRAMNNKNKV
jgi:hypothetical protein